MQSLNMFIRMSTLIPEGKKFALTNDYENIITYLEES